jgi:hypothetical protein
LDSPGNAARSNIQETLAFFLKGTPQVHVSDLEYEQSGARLKADHSGQIKTEHMSWQDRTTNVIPERFAFPGRSATLKFNALVKLEAIPNNAKLININSTKNYGD